MDELDVKKDENVSTPVEATQKRTRAPRKVAAPAPIQEAVANIPAYISPEDQRKKECKERWMKLKEHKSKPVTGKFLFNECPGGELKFAYREFPGDPIKHYVMRHDTIHTVPLGVAMHLNDNCNYVEYQHNLDAGKAVNADAMYISSKIHRTNFIPLDWSLNVGNTTGNSVAQVTFTNPLDNRYNLDSTGKHVNY